MLDVPAYIEYAPQSENGALVVNGSNWDLSRGAAALPVRPAVEEPAAAFESPAPALTQYAANTGLAGREPVAVMTFAANASKVDVAAKKELCQLSKDGRYELAGHAHKAEKKVESLASTRANNVAKTLRLCGLQVQRTTGFGSSLVAPSEDALAQRRVEIFLAE